MAKHTLHVINGSHPCAAVLRAYELKGIPVRVREYMPPLHAPIMRARFGSGRVPLLVLPGGERVPGSRRIMQRLEALQPEPPLYPRAHVAAIEEAERWGDEVLQGEARMMFWGAVRFQPNALASFQAGSRLPKFPSPMVRLIAPLVIAGEERLNQITTEKVRAALAALPEYLDQIGRFHQADAFGAATPTAADLQIGSSLQLMRAIEDVRPMIDSHPFAREVARWLPAAPGSVPAGSLPADWLPQLPSASR